MKENTPLIFQFWKTHLILSKSYAVGRARDNVFIAPQSHYPSFFVRINFCILCWNKESTPLKKLCVTITSDDLNKKDQWQSN